MQAPGLLVILTAVIPSLVGCSPTPRHELSQSHPRPSPSNIVDSRDTHPIEPCAQVAQLVRSITAGPVNVDITLAYQCLQSVPIKYSQAKKTIDAIKKLSQFQSTIKHLKNPAINTLSPTVDVLTELDKIARRVLFGGYRGQYEFEVDLARLIMSANDGHFRFEGSLLSDVFSFRRPAEAALISVSIAGKGPELFTRDNYYLPDVSPVTQINGYGALGFVEYAAWDFYFHDSDARLNYMLARTSKTSKTDGGFRYPTIYPGPHTNLTFANGNTVSLDNVAVVKRTDWWYTVVDGMSAYEAFVNPHGKDGNAESLSAGECADYSEDSYYNYFPCQQHSSPRSVPDVDAGEADAIEEDFFDFEEEDDFHDMEEIAWVDDGLSGATITLKSGAKVAILEIRSFFRTAGDQYKFIEILDNLFRTWREQKVSKVIVDLRGNHGGAGGLHREAFLYFFPGQVPFDGKRQRSSEAAQYMAYFLSNVEVDGDQSELAPFSMRSKVDKDLQPFREWADLYDSTELHDDQFTKLYRWNPATFRSNAKEVTFLPEDIVLFGDGVCLSACAIFVELMKSFAPQIKTITVGGMPNKQFPATTLTGGTRGQTVQSLERLMHYFRVVEHEFGEDMTHIFPMYLPIQYSVATVNIVDTIRTPDATAATQFLFDPSDCRLFYTDETFDDEDALWNVVYDAAFSGPGGGINKPLCVAGSTDQPPAVVI